MPTTEIITQRIKYLIEHGGLLEDPLTEIQKDMRRALRVVSVVAIIGAAHLVWDLIHR